jgi:hypothetical protein
MIKLLLNNGDYTPVIICDECKKMITKAEDGIAFSWHRSSDTGALGMSEVMQLADLDEPEFHNTVYLHTGNCHVQRSAQHDQKHIVISDEPLEIHLYGLLQSLGLNTKGSTQSE